MMAVRSPLAPMSAGSNLLSAFSPFSDHPASPRPPTTATTQSASIAYSFSSDTEKANLLVPPSPNAVTSPGEPFDPSPVAPSSNGTDFTDVDPVVIEKEEDVQQQSAFRFKSPTSVNPELKIETTKTTPTPYQRRSDEDEPPQSVIHVPTEFTNFHSNQRNLSRAAQAPAKASDRPTLEEGRTGSADSVKSDATVKLAEDMEDLVAEKTEILPPTPLETSLTTEQEWLDRSTPRAQTRHEFDLERRPRSSLASVPEGEDGDQAASETGDESEAFERVSEYLRDTEAEVNALKTALSECWTLCNTLANLSHIHRERIFNVAGRGDMQEQAWKSCWKLCQNLYASREDDSVASVRPTLDLCRDFCQTLFEVRVRENETADSVLRVSFELNNHLFNTHDRNLPEMFRERTLDFYITLCHRLMKQKSRTVDETDSLLRACWSLAEMLFTLRQNKREGKAPDEEILGSTIQACWELCDLFREGWTKIRPDRGTPRPSQTTFTQAYHQAKRNGFTPVDEIVNQKQYPETPTTIFEDTATFSPDEAPHPNIFVLGTVSQPQSAASTLSASISTQQSTSTGATRHAITEIKTSRPRWPSSSSTRSAPHRDSASAISERSTSTIRSASFTTLASSGNNPNEDLSLTLLKILFIKAAQNSGFSRTNPTHKSLAVFVENLPDTAFGVQNWQMNLLDNYKKVVATDPGFATAGSVSGNVRAGAVEVARAVQQMVQSSWGFGWLRDLYRLVFGFYIEEAGRKGQFATQT